MRPLFLLLIAIFTSGCIRHAKVLELQSYTKLSTPSVSVQTPDIFPKTPWKAWYLNAESSIQLWRYLPNMMSEDVSMKVSTLTNESMSKYNYELLDKEKSDLLEKTILTSPLTEWEKKNYAERGVQYSKGFIEYVDGLRCRTSAESGNLALGVGSKRYQTFCNYYDIQGNPKELWINYTYTYTHSGTKYDGDSQSGSVSPEMMQIQFKQDMKAIFDSLVIHDMDRERMSKAGLLHERKYEIQQW